MIKKLLLIGIIINFIYVLSGAVHYPLRSVDVYGIWLFKAKAFYLENGIPLKTLTNPRYFYTHPYYPLLLPFTYYLGFRALGFVADQHILLVFPLVYLFICSLVYFSLRLLHISRFSSLLFTFIYSHFSVLLAQSGRMHSGNADIVIVLLLWMLFVTILRHRSYWLTPLIVILASQIKTEGIFLSPLIFLLPINRNKKIIIFILSLLPFIIWQIFRINHRFSIGQTFIIYNIPELIARSLSIFKYIPLEMFNFRNWYIFWQLFLLLLVFVPGKAYPSYPVFWHKFLLLIIPFFLIIYLFSPYAPKASIPSSADRIMFQLSPFFYPLFCLKLNQLVNYPPPRPHPISSSVKSR